MAKPTVTEEELKAGLSSLGGFGGLTGAASTTRRDSPFGTSFAKASSAPLAPPQQQQPTPVAAPVERAAQVVVPKPETVIELKTQVPQAVAPVVSAPVPAPHQSVVSATEQPVASPVAQAPVVTPAPRVPQAPAALTTKERADNSSPIAAKRRVPSSPPRVAQPTEGEERASTPHSAPKSDMYTERVTTIMSPEMRDRLNQLAANLQRRKNDPTERITANTLTRVAINVFLEQLLPLDTEAPRTEEELYALTKAKVTSKR